jgi:penicillin-insensitive murein endopeptidase
VRFAPLSIAALVATLTFSSGAFPGAAPRTRTASRTATAVSGALGKSLGPAALRYGVSIGSPTEGHLLGGAHLEATPYLRVVPSYDGGDVRWGLEPLVAMIDRAARAIRRQYPEAVTSVGHLSREGGGDVDRHRSHESGRDADIAFFVKSASGRQLLASHFVQFRGDGTAASWPGAYFDDAKNWALVASLVSDPEAHVTHLFVAAPLRARLLGYAERMGVPAALRMRAAEVLQQPHGALPHDDHFHVRISCPAHMSGCVENPAVRSRPAAPSLVAHGRRGAPSHVAAGGLVTPAPTHTPLPSLPSPAPSTPASSPHEDDTPGEPDAPPASIPAPIDDVDG